MPLILLSLRFQMNFLENSFKSLNKKGEMKRERCKWCPLYTSTEIQLHCGGVVRWGGCVGSISWIREPDPARVVFKPSFIRRWGEKLILPTLIIDLSFLRFLSFLSFLYSTMKRICCVSPYLWLSFPVLGYVQVGPSVFQSLSFFKYEELVYEDTFTSSASAVFVWISLA